MNEPARVTIAKLPTGIAGLDDILGGGLPEYSFNLIVGTPGSGKTTMAHQIMFGLASAKRPALYFTVLGEPPLKMLRYQQQMAFFDPTKVGSDIRFYDLSDVVLEHNLTTVLERIVQHVEEAEPGLVFVDSFQTVVRAASDMDRGGIDLQGFVQRLAVHLTTWQATTFLIGEDAGDTLRGNPLFTVADGIVALSQQADRNSVVRKLQVMKSRGQSPMPGVHTFRITQEGIQVFPRMSMTQRETDRERPTGRVLTGVAGLDELVGGGIPAGDAVLIVGPSGVGKSVFTAQFIVAGARQGEPGVIVIFEEHPEEYLRRATVLGSPLEEMVRQGTVEIIYLRPMDLSPDETLFAIRESVGRVKARRVAIDSISGFEMALAPTFRMDFRESLYRLVGALTGTGVTVLMTMEIMQSSSELRLSPYAISFLADDILLLRYVEIAGYFHKNLVVVKMRNSDHSKDLVRYEITSRGLVVRDSLREGTVNVTQAGLTDMETVILQALLELGQGPSEAVSIRTGVREPELTAALNRLVSLNYAGRRKAAAGVIYWPVARALG